MVFLALQHLTVIDANRPPIFVLFYEREVCSLSILSNSVSYLVAVPGNRFFLRLFSLISYRVIFFDLFVVNGAKLESDLVFCNVDKYH